MKTVSRKAIVLAAACFAIFFSSCKKETTELQPIVCFFGVTIPVRIITAAGNDLLSPASLPSGKLDMQWIYQQSTNPVSTTPNVYTKAGQADQYYIPLPVSPAADNGFTVLFSLKNGDTDTLYIRTSPSSSKHYGLTQTTFNGRPVETKPILENIIGLELVKDGTGN